MTGSMIGADGDEALPSVPGLHLTTYLGGPLSGPACPPGYADVPVRELFAQIDAQRRQRAAAAAGESLAAGFRPRTPLTQPGSGSGFESGGALDASSPGGSLAGLADAATRDGHLTELDDDELIGVLRAWQRLESWCSAGLLDAVAELARRRPAEKTAPAPPGAFPAQLSEFVGDEVAAALTMTARTADGHADLSLDLKIRLPGTDRALHLGVLNLAKARLIAEATRVLSDDQAREVEERILAAAGQQTTGQLRAAVARAVLAVDPGAATRRREEAQKNPRVSRWQEDAGTAALAGFGLPPADVLAADQRLTTRARALRETGLPGTLGELRARAYLDALLGQDPTSPAARNRAADPDRPADPDRAADPDQPADSDEPAPGQPGQAGQRADRRPLAARTTLTVPLATYLGLADELGQVGGFGPVDPALARDLAIRAAAHPASRFCVTVTGTDGRAIGHGCIPGRPPDQTTPLGPPGFNVTITPLAGADCDHRHQEPGYQPSRRLQHLITARSPTCRAPGCARPAARCDLDHTDPYDRGGPTCECNLAPLCRHHHRCKQSEGWRLRQLSPGVMCWTTPAGRRYLTVPAPIAD
jgi:hypothetical protein